MADADAVLFVVDADTGVTEEDARAAEVVRRPLPSECSSSPTRSTTPTARRRSGT